MSGVCLYGRIPSAIIYTYLHIVIQHVQFKIVVKIKTHSRVKHKTLFLGSIIKVDERLNYIYSTKTKKYIGSKKLISLDKRC